MKKLHFLLAAAALLACAACSKVTPVETPDQAISFQVAKYTSSTKANVSLLSDGLTSFHTYAIFHPATGDTHPVQMYMDNVEITPDNATAPTEWKPTDRTYYWPKTGSLNFYSYAGTRVPTTAPSVAGESQMVFANLEIVGEPVAETNNAQATPADNILVADPARNQTANASTYHVDNANVKGVPTLFKHMLAKVRFVVVLDATGLTSTDANRTTWTLTIPAQTLFSVKNASTLTITYGTNTNDFTAAWSNWGDGTAEVKAVAKTISTVGGQKNPAANADPNYILAYNEFVVIPQSITGNNAIPVSFSAELKSSYKATSDSQAEEIKETISLPANQKLDGFTNAFTAWEANHIYTYTITVKPNEPIKFDPAVTEWVDNENLVINVPQQ